jgi:hypothetical protein
MRRFRPAVTLAPRYDDQPVLGLPRGAMVITNTSRKDMWCPRRWWYSRGLGLKSPTSAAMRFGSLFDDVMGGILEWYLNRPQSARGPSLAELQGEDMDGPLGMACAALWEAQDLYQESGGVEAEIERLCSAVEGWLNTYGDQMATDYQVLAVQPTYAVPITSPRTGQVYRSKVPVVTVEQGWRLATGHDAPESVSHVTLPWFQLVKLDGVVLHRRENTVWAWETKTSANPEGYSRALPLDTQLPGYTRALWYVTQELGEFGGKRIGGYVWDVSSSKPHKSPRKLKDGRFSTATNQRVPSWRWQAIVDGLPPEAECKTRIAEQEYLVEVAQGYVEECKGTPRYKAAKEAAKAATDLLKRLQHDSDLWGSYIHAKESVDPTLYVRRWGEFTLSQLAQYEVELYQDAVRTSGWLRKLPGTAGALTKGEQWRELDATVALHFPRVPFCRSPGGFCPYTGPCLQDSLDVRSTFEEREPLKWFTSKAAEDRLRERSK